MTSNSKTVSDYLKGLPAGRRDAIETVRHTILQSLPKGYEECMLYGMIGYVVPHSIYPAGYHCDPSKPLTYALLCSQKNHMAIYLMGVYGDSATNAWFTKAWKATGKKLDMGKACVRFKKIEDVALEVVGQVIAHVPVAAYISRVQAILNRKPGKPGKSKPVKKKK